MQRRRAYGEAADIRPLRKPSTRSPKIRLTWRLRFLNRHHATKLRDHLNQSLVQLWTHMFPVTAMTVIGWYWVVINYKKLSSLLKKRSRWRLVQRTNGADKLSKTVATKQWAKLLSTTFKHRMEFWQPWTKSYPKIKSEQMITTSVLTCERTSSWIWSRGNVTGGISLVSTPMTGKVDASSKIYKQSATTLCPSIKNWPFPAI